MYKLLIIDDEELIRKGLIAQLKHLGIEFEDIKEAFSGVEALEILKEYPAHIVISDIRMPDMDGLSFINEANKKYPKIHFILLSGYAEFEYAEKAIELGVKAYLLKPISSNELKKVMLKMIDSIKQEENLKSTIETVTKEKTKYLVEKRINSLLILSLAQLNEIEGGDTNYINQQLNISENDRIYLVVINIDGISYKSDHFKYSDVELIRFSVENVFDEIVSCCNKRIVNNLSNVNQLYAIISYSNTNILRKEVERLFLFIQEVFEKKMDIYLTFGVSGVVTSINYEARQQAVDALSQRLVYGKSNVYFYEDMVVFQEIKFPTSELDMLSRYLERRDIGNIITIVNDIFDEDKIIKYPIAYARILWVRMLNLILRNYGSKINSEVGADKFLRNMEISDNINSITELKNKFIKIVMDCIGHEGDFKTNARNKIKMSVSYINEHFNEDIAVNELAEKFELSPNYFSTLFKKEMKQSAINYITEVRIEKAKEYLINSDRSVFDIAKSVGYSDSQYFFRVFKKITGMTPLNYRHRYQDKF